MLLHDMGEGLADSLQEGRATGREWRTAPLWGIGKVKQVTGHTHFLHDGRARSIEEAILWHGGEAEASRDAYARLSPKRSLVTFFPAFGPNAILPSRDAPVAILMDSYSVNILSRSGFSTNSP